VYDTVKPEQAIAAGIPADLAEKAARGMSALVEPGLVRIEDVEDGFRQLIESAEWLSVARVGVLVPKSLTEVAAAIHARRQKQEG
jgi:hypothetical protein